MEGVSHAIDPKDPGLVTSSPAARVLLLLTSPPPPLLLSLPPLLLSLPPLNKEDLYGVLDPNTREWRDGLFTHILRRIIDNVRGEINKRQWIIFDGDVDPEWVRFC